MSRRRPGLRRPIKPTVPRMETLEARMMLHQGSDPLGLVAAVDRAILATPPRAAAATPPAGPTIDALRVAAVGTRLDATFRTGGLAGPGVTYTIAPQPLPGHAAFNESTGAFHFIPSPDQVGHYEFTVTATKGTRTAVERVPVTAVRRPTATTEVAGQVVDEAGRPLAGVPVMIGTIAATTGKDGRFTLTGVPAKPGPLSVDGQHYDGGRYMMLMAPTPQLLGHAAYPGVANVVPRPIVLPKVDLAHATDFRKVDARKALDLTSPLLPGVVLHVAAGSAVTMDGMPFTGKLALTKLPVAQLREMLPQGVLPGTMVGIDGPDLMFRTPARLTLPNTTHAAPGTVMALNTMNMATGGFDRTGLLRVSADGKSLTTISGGVTGSTCGYWIFRIIEIFEEIEPCDCGSELTGDFSTPGTNQQPTGGPAGNPDPIATPRPIFASDAGLTTGSYFQDHPLVTYQSQGLARVLDLQYSSLQADPRPVVQGEATVQPFTAPGLTSVTAQVTLGGVTQSPVTFNVTGSPPATYRLPVQVDGTGLATGAYPYSMAISQNFATSGGSGGSGGGTTALTSQFKGQVNVVDEVNSHLGAGWTVGGLQRISAVGGTTAPVLLTAGSQGTERYDYLPPGPLQDLAPLTYTSVPGSGGSSTIGAQLMANDGMGGLGAPGSAATATAAAAPAGAVTGDFNGDGKADLAVAAGGTVSIFLANGVGGFTAGASYTTAAAPIALAAGNFTGHATAILDLAVLLQNGSVAVLAGSGSGTFTAGATTTLGGGSISGIGSMAAGDFNGDGTTDLAVGSTGNGLLRVLIGNGTGGFTASSPGSLASQYVVAGDLTNDGKLDLAVAAGGVLTMMVGNGTGGFTAAGTDDLHAGPIGGLAIGNFFDVNQLAVAELDPLDNSIITLAGSTLGTWGPEVYTPSSVTGASNAFFAGADVNGDGRADLLAFAAGNLQVYPTVADTNQFGPTESFPLPANSVGFAVGAFTGRSLIAHYRAPMGDPSTLTYNGTGTWTRAYPDGTVVQFDTSGREVSKTDRNGNATTFAYVASGPAAGALQAMTDPAGLATTLVYDASGHLSTVTDPAGRVTTVTVDSSGNLTKIVDPDGAVIQYGYATPANHRITTEVNPDNRTATAHYNAFGRLQSETLFDGVTTIPLSPAEVQGLLAPGASGPLPLPAGYAGTVTDANGHATALTFNANDHPTAAVDGAGRTTATAYDMMGNAVASTDPDGRTTTYTYNAYRDVASVQRPDGTTMTINRGIDDRVTRVVDFKGQATTYTLDAHGNVTRRTDPDLGHEDFTYNAAGQVLTDADRNGRTTTYTYDSYGRLARINYPFASGSSPSVAYGYDAAGDQITVTDELGHITTMAYDLAGRRLSTQDPVQGTAGVKAVYAYDAAGNLLSVTDALGHQTTYAYDARNREVGMTDPADQGTGRQYTYGYDAAGNLTSVTDPLGHQTTYAYDGDNRQVGMTDATGHATTRTYDPAGQLVNLIDPNGNATTYTYDRDGRLQTKVVPTAPPVMHSGSGGTYTTQATAVTSYTYDADNNLISVVEPMGETLAYGYDQLNRRVSATAYPAGTGGAALTTAYGYDAVGNRITVTDPLGHTTTYAYDVRNRLVAETGPSGGGTTTYAYNAASRLVSLTDPDGNTTSYGYDAANRVTTVTDPLGHVTTTTYDAAGNVTGVTDRDNRQVTYAYDPDNREVAETWYPAGGGAALRTVTMAYDAAGRLTSIQDPNSDYAFGYDADNRLTSVDNSGTPGMPHVVVTYAYDADGNRTSLDDNFNGLTSYTYDVRDEMTGETQSGTGVAAKSVAFAYDDSGRMTTLTRYSNLAGTIEVGATTYTYDQADRLTGLTNTTATGGVISSYAYTLDAAGRLTQEVRAWANPGSGGGTLTDTLTYAYTNNNQLTGVTHTNTSFANESFSYDANGNRNSAGYSTGANNELASDGTYTYTYDNEGNLVSKTAIVGGNQTLYSYDDRNRLTEVDQVVGGVHSTMATYTYDALGRQIGEKAGSAVRWTAYDKQTPILDLNSTGSATARYMSVPNAVDYVLARETNGGVVAWYLADRIGTIRDITNNSGIVIDRVDYGVFGNLITQSNSSNGDRFGFAYTEYDGADGLNYDRFRYYYATQGRFITQDNPASIITDANIYRYAGNSVVDSYDPSGHDWIGAISGGITGTIISVTIVGLAVGTLVLIGGVAALPATAVIIVAVVVAGTVGGVGGAYNGSSETTVSGGAYAGVLPGVYGGAAGCIILLRADPRGTSVPPGPQQPPYDPNTWPVENPRIPPPPPGRPWAR